MALTGVNGINEIGRDVRYGPARVRLRVVTEANARSMRGSVVGRPVIPVLHWVCRFAHFCIC